jgi:hypothetical protein
VGKGVGRFLRGGRVAVQIWLVFKQVCHINQTCGAAAAGLKKISCPVRRCDKRSHGGVRRRVGREIPDDFKILEGSRRNEVIPFFKFSPQIRKAVYTANAIEPVDRAIQKIIRRRQSFPNDEAAVKLIFMGLKNISRNQRFLWVTLINLTLISFTHRHFLATL